MSKNYGAGLEALVLLSQLGLTLAMPIVLGVLAGHWLDEKLGTNILFFTIFVVAGIAAGIFAAYQQVIHVTKKKK